MEKKSKVLIVIFILTLFASLGYSYYRYISAGDFLIDESQVEAEGEVIDEATGEPVFEENDGAAEIELETEVGV